MEIAKGYLLILAFFLVIVTICVTSTIIEPRETRDLREDFDECRDEKWMLEKELRECKDVRTAFKEVIKERLNE